MPINISPDANPHIRALLDRALASTNGISFFVESKGRAIQLIQSAYSIRARDRAANAKIFPADHPQFGRSVYDGLSFLKTADPTSPRWQITIAFDIIPEDLQLFDAKTGEEL